MMNEHGACEMKNVYRNIIKINWSVNEYKFELCDIDTFIQRVWKIKLNVAMRCGFKWKGASKLWFNICISSLLSGQSKIVEKSILHRDSDRELGIFIKINGLGGLVSRINEPNVDHLSIDFPFTYEILIRVYMISAQLIVKR